MGKVIPRAFIDTLGRSLLDFGLVLCARELCDNRLRWRRLSVLAIAATAIGCGVRKTTRVAPVQPVAPAKEAPASSLIAYINSRNDSIKTLTATVDLQPTAGSVYSGIIKEYRDVRGFILIEKPAMIRILGQAPIVRTNIFDMVSDGEQFRLYIPTKQKFYVGRNAFWRPAKNALENLRPQHILDALLIPPMDSSRDKYIYEEAEEGGRRFYVVTVVQGVGDQEMIPQRKIWFDRGDLEIARLQLYGPRGAYLEDVLYSAYGDFQGVHYPTKIQVIRPLEDYRLAITIQKATFNQSIAREKFELKKPASAQLIDLSADPKAEGPRGQ